KIVTCKACLPVRQAAWSYRDDYCQGCRTKDLPHKAGGLCQTCYRRKQFLGGPLVCTQSDCSNQTYRNFAAGVNVMCADCYNEQGRRIFQLIEQRMPLTEIAKKFRLSTRTIKQILRFYSPGEESDLRLHHYHVVKTDNLQ
ncbi:MAG: helix-turn-helix domain-containing protein, partial [Patescibacteria group bacterium]